MTTGIEPWEHRLAKMDHSKGTSNRMIQAAMKAEIMEMRKLRKSEASALHKAQLANTAYASKVTDQMAELNKLRPKAAAMDKVKLSRDASEAKVAALQAEIKKLQKLLRPEDTAWRKVKLAHAANTSKIEELQAALVKARKQIAYTNRTVDSIRSSRDEWKASANRYRKSLLTNIQQKEQAPWNPGTSTRSATSTTGY